MFLAVAGVQDLDTTAGWHEYGSFSGITVEYKITNYIKEGARDQVLVLFRFANTTSDDLRFTWVTKEFRAGECSNCSRLSNPEYQRSIDIKSGEMIEGDPTTMEDQNVFLFSHFVKMVPGMSAHNLTDFEFVEVNVEQI